MGQTASSVRPDPGKFQKPVAVRITYNVGDGLTTFDEKEVVLLTDVFARVGELKELADKLKKEAEHHIINVYVILGTSFRPTGVMKSAAMKHILSGVFNGLGIRLLDIDGDFDPEVDYWAKIKWWEDMQHFVTNMGFKFSRGAEIRCDAIKPGYRFTIDNQWPREQSMSHLAINVDGVVFLE